MVACPVISPSIDPVLGRFGRVARNPSRDFAGGDS